MKDCTSIKHKVKKINEIPPFNNILPKTMTPPKNNYYIQVMIN